MSSESDERPKVSTIKKMDVKNYFEKGRAIEEIRLTPWNEAHYLDLRSKNHKNILSKEV